MKSPLTLHLAIAGLTIASLAFASTPAPLKPMKNTKPSIVLVHGAFANASAWSRVIEILQKDGYTVTAVQDPMTSYADDVAATKRVLEVQKQPVVLVGHSYGGAVITGAATDKVKALVYVAAFAPDEGENLTDLQQKYPALLGTAIVPDTGGFLTIDRDKFHKVFAADLPESETRVMAAAQGPLKGDIFATSMGLPAWKGIPSWYVVCQEDNAINPDLERFYAKRIGAHITEVKASHVPFLSQPGLVAKVIEEAARAVEQKN